MRSVRHTVPKIQVARGGRPPRSPRKTARGLPEPSNNRALEPSIVITNAQMAWAELLVLNGRGPPDKREELETGLDRSILALSRMVREVKKPKKKDSRKVTDILRSIRDYR